VRFASNQVPTHLLIVLILEFPMTAVNRVVNRECGESLSTVPSLAKSLAWHRSSMSDYKPVIDAYFELQSRLVLRH
jgi:hypothetical protein